METLLLEILSELKTHRNLDDRRLESIIRRHNRKLYDTEKHHAKKKILPYYLDIKKSHPEQWTRWNIDEETEKQLIQALRVKRRRTSSGVATITVITKPWTCSSDCLYCPNDLRMPKSYLHNEPACQRAERNFFDPYVQVVARLEALQLMGHVTDKIEVIILGGTWSDYPLTYQIWFITEIFRALNDGERAEERAQERYRFYKASGFSNDREKLAINVSTQQNEVNAGHLRYNQAFDLLYQSNPLWTQAAAMMVATPEDLAEQQRINETAQHRVVGLAIETRPDNINIETLTMLRSFGCTKIQMGVQSLQPHILELNERAISIASIQKSFDLLRAFGFKIHAHFMLNLYGSSLADDLLDYQRFVNEQPYQPDEVKLYPCALIEGTRLCRHYADGSWQPYTEEELIGILAAATISTPPFTRISRMIRDFSADDILVGNKKTNMRQLVERRIEELGETIQEIRSREISTTEIALEDLMLEVISYETTATHEHFLQWVTPDNRIAGFLRLSLPKTDVALFQAPALPIHVQEAMIREVHIYGKVAALSSSREGAQHLGLGKRLIERACAIAQEQGYDKINVISSIGTREYYRSIGFQDNNLYQQKKL